MPILLTMAETFLPPLPIRCRDILVIDVYNRLGVADHFDIDGTVRVSPDLALDLFLVKFPAGAIFRRCTGGCVGDGCEGTARSAGGRDRLAAVLDKGALQRARQVLPGYR